MTSAQQETFAMFDTILSLQPKVSKGRGLSRDKNVEDVANDILKRIPDHIEIPGKNLEIILDILSQLCS
jgi:dynein heavy chain